MSEKRQKTGEHTIASRNSGANIDASDNVTVVIFYSGLSETDG